MKQKKGIYIIDKVLLSAVMLIMTYQLYNMFTSYENQFTHPVQYVKETYKKDNITLYGDRFDDIKKYLHTPTIMGYVGEANEGFVALYYNYIMTQYYLSPNLVLKQNTNLDTVLYNLYDTKSVNTASNFHLNNGWHLVKDFNNGLIIFAK